MTEKNIIDSDYDWRKTEEVPYKECPNCGEYKYRRLIEAEYQSTAETRYEKWFNILIFAIYAEWKVVNEEMKCKNCHYSKEP